MDSNSKNNNSPQKPRKRVTKKMLRRRQLTALAVIFFIIVMIILLATKGCSPEPKESSSEDESSTTIPIITDAVEPETTEPETTQPVTTEPETTEVPTADPNDPNTITKIELTDHEFYLEVGQQAMSMVTMYPLESTELGEIWTSSDEKVATVDEYGLITAISPGTCFVTVQSENNPSVDAVIRVNVTDSGYVDDYYAGQTSDRSREKDSDTSRLQLLADEAKAPPVYADEGLTYIKDILIVNKEYGLPPNFAPGLEDICSEQFERLSEDAAEEGLNIYIGSAYRSYFEQIDIFNEYVTEYGVNESDTFSARPGHSEHQTGLTIDCNTIDDAFGETDEAKWLAEHAHEYGFIIRYPLGKEDITGYQYEPWHIRYVGYTVAKEMYKSGECLEEYLGLA